MTDRIYKVSAISYLNSVPFTYGLRYFQKELGIELEEDYPARCAEKLLNDQADIGLVPVFIIPSLKKYEIISNFCIGASGKIRTVLLLSQKPVKEIKQVYLDFHSKTSVNLAKILSKELWQISPEWVPLTEKHEITKLESVVLIGDKTFTMADKFSYSYDLSEEWQKLTGLPFVFACWVANTNLPEVFKEKFNHALSFGLDNMEKSIRSCNSPISPEESLNYLKNNVSYDFDNQKQKALTIYLDFIKHYEFFKF